LGRIGRAKLKVILETAEMRVVAVNDLKSIKNAAYLFKYYSVYGVYEGKVGFDDN